MIVVVGNQHSLEVDLSLMFQGLMHGHTRSRLVLIRDEGPLRRGEAAERGLLRFTFHLSDSRIIMAGMTPIALCRFLGIICLLFSAGAADPGLSGAQALRLTLQKRVETAPGSGEYRIVSSTETWPSQKTAVIVCDMWDLHHSKNAVLRVREMTPRMNQALEKARSQGVFIIHAPSSCMKFYEGHPARARASAAPRAANLPADIGEWCRKIPAEERGVYPIDQSDGGEDDNPVQLRAWAEELKAKGLNPREPWTRQVDALKIYDQDAISDSGVEIWNLLEQRGITNVILMGVHVNMCVSGRPFGLRQMARNGKHVVLMRDMTDSMYNPSRWPYVDHHKGTALFIEHVEKFICPTITSDQIVGGRPFVFKGDSSGTAGD